MDQLGSNKAQGVILTGSNICDCTKTSKLAFIEWHCVKGKFVICSYFLPKIQMIFLSHLKKKFKLGVIIKPEIEHNEYHWLTLHFTWTTYHEWQLLLPSTGSTLKHELWLLRYTEYITSSASSTGYSLGLLQKTVSHNWKLEMCYLQCRVVGQRKSHVE